ncbi:MAG: lysophospholipid acyltransferase family protein [Planctomycetes bacterium]|nr:lysophospholipid acyltransferase family protein [Planctomycetota bacterium]
MTWSIRQHGTSYFKQRVAGGGKRVVYSFWHRDILLLGYFARNEGTRVLISQHRDGELIARVVQRLGYQVFRGSTTRGGVKALKSLDRIKNDPTECDIAFTPDGPKGPAKKLQKGVIFAAARTGFPIVPVGVAVDRCWEMRSWDRFRIPKPFSRSFIVYGEEIPVDTGMGDEEMEAMQAYVEARMFETEQRAGEALDQWRNSG